MKNRFDLAYWIALSRIKGIGPKAFQQLSKHFSDFKVLWKIKFKDLISTGLEPRKAKLIINNREKLEPEEELRLLKQHQVQAVTIKDKSYPELLLEIPDPPPVLYYKGSLPGNNHIALAAIGSRKSTEYGHKCAESIVKKLANYEIEIISGLALGLDTICHQVCITNGRNTYAVLPCALSQVYPLSNLKLAQKIIQNGGLISEYPIGSDCSVLNFHARNRIISGLSKGVLVFEAGIKSGTLITVNHALEQGREVFAVPGNIFSSQSQGVNSLIQKGAKLTQDEKDILDELNIKTVSKKIKKNHLKLFPNDPIKQEIVKSLAHYNNFEKLIKKMKINGSTLNANLTELELSGLIKKQDQGNYILVE
ncbi:MAG: DNA-protecting protein DprA [Candidatus Moranbacteria bacterium]|nr:DNA-protecting protein DprA [Candidatus Moranbacteria bacterium]